MLNEVSFSTWQENFYSSTIQVLDGCLNGEDEIDVTCKNTATLIKLLTDNDSVTVNNALRMVYQYLFIKDSQKVLMNIPEIVPSLIDILIRSNDFETTNYTLRILYRLSEDQQNLESIYKSNGVPALVKFLSSHEKNVLFYALIMLHNILMNKEDSKTVVCKVGGLQKIVMLLKQDNETLLVVVTDCLRILAFQNPENKLLVLASDGPAELVRILENCSNKSLLWNSLRVLKTLSVCPSNNCAIVAAGGMKSLAKHLDNQSKKIVVECLSTLRNLSNLETKQRNPEVIQKSIRLLKSSDADIVEYAVCILCNMSFNNNYNKEIVFREMGIGALLNTILRARNTEEIIEPAICVLCNLTSHYPKAEAAQNAIRLHSGLRVIVELLYPPSSWSLIKTAIELVRNLALCPSNREPLRGLGTVHVLKNILNSVHEDITKNRGRLSHCEAPPTIVGGVRMEDIVEDTLRAMLFLARNVNIRNIVLKDLTTMDTLVQILFKENETIQCLVVGIFCEIALDPDGILAIENAGALPFLGVSIRSKNKALASKSEYLLDQLLDFLDCKPHEYALAANLNKIRLKYDSDPRYELL